MATNWAGVLHGAIEHLAQQGHTFEPMSDEWNAAEALRASAGFGREALARTLAKTIEAWLADTSREATHD